MTSPKVVKTEEGPDIPLFKIILKWIENRRNGHLSQRLVLETGDWVNVVAITADHAVVVVRQFRSGNDRFTLEIPGGTVHRGESHLDAAKRELREETGYTSDIWEYLGYVEPNPAIQNNRCHHWLAREANKTHEKELDEGEDIAVDCLPLRQFRKEIQTGTISHALALSAISRVPELWAGVDFSGLQHADHGKLRSEKNE